MILLRTYIFKKARLAVKKLFSQLQRINKSSRDNLANMKSFLFILIYSLKVCFLNSDNNLNSPTLALENVTEFLFDTVGRVSVINYECDLQYFESVVMKNVKRRNVPFALKNSQKFSKNTQQERLEVDESGIIAVDSVDSLKDFNGKVDLTNEYPKSLKFFVLIKNANVKSLSTIPDTTILQFQYFLTEEDAFVKIWTFVWYTPELCNKTQLVEVNRFSKMKKAWMSNKFVIEKFQNFHGCDVRFGLYFENPAQTFRLQDGKLVYGGFHIGMFSSLSRVMNYSVSFNPFFAKDENSEMELYLPDPVDALVQLYKQKHTNEVNDSFITRQYVYFSDVVAVPPGEKYSAYEKLGMPFDATTWILITFTFFAAFSTIFVMNFVAGKIRNFVFGRNIKTPALNVLMIFFGISQVTLPRRNFARFIVIIFIFYSLIMRTAWQAMIFEQMQKNITKPEIKNVEEFAERNFALYLLAGTSVHEFKSLEIFERQVLMNFLEFSIRKWKFIEQFFDQ